LNAIGVKDGMSVLEVGCGAGIFCNRIKTYLPKCQVTGLDFDTGHIEYAKTKSAELGLDCTFVNGDATNLPFGNEIFDLCYSHTVVEHIPTEPFFKEQKRVLKPGGRIVVMSVRTKMGLHTDEWNAIGGREQELRDKVWQVAERNQPRKDIGGYEMREEDYPKMLERFGFHDVNVDFITAVPYAPDNATVPETMAKEQIEYQRYSNVNSAEKAILLAPDVLTDAEKDELFRLTNERFDARIEAYRRGEKRWDMSVSTVLVASGRK